MAFSFLEGLPTRKARKRVKLRPRAPRQFEVLEDRLAPAVIILDSVRTTDSREAIVNYAITTSNLTQPFAIQIYRSDQSTFSSTDQNNVAVGAPYMVTDLSAGPHNITIDLASPAPGEPSAPVEPLAPDPTLPYVLAVADPQHTLPGNVTIDESQASFRIFVIADVSPGFGIIVKPQWVQDMVKELQGIGYDSVEPLDWNASTPLPGQAVLAGNNLYAQILGQANGLQSKVTGNDVIDVQLIGHSRGTSVVGWAMQDLVSQLSSAPDALQEGYFGLTLLDPHPANADTADEVSLVTTGIPVVGLEAILLNEVIGQNYNDPPITVAGRVNQTDIYYQQNSIAALSPASLQANPMEAYINEWGVPSQVTISDPQATVTNEYNLSSLGLGHNDVRPWYQDNVIPLLKIDAPPPVPAPPGGPSPPPATTVDISELLFPEFVDDQGVADSLAGDLDAAINDLSLENQSQAIGDLEAFDTAIDAAPTADFPDGNFTLLSTSQNMIDDLGPAPSTTAGTIYWTGDAGPDDAGDYNWDQAGNWSTIDPKVQNVSQNILPGPLDNVVVDLPNADIDHDDEADDTISSLTVTGQNDTLDLDDGTLDLSGSGAPAPSTFRARSISPCRSTAA